MSTQAIIVGKWYHVSGYPSFRPLAVVEFLSQYNPQSGSRQDNGCTQERVVVGRRRIVVVMLEIAPKS